MVDRSMKIPIWKDFEDCVSTGRQGGILNGVSTRWNALFEYILFAWFLSNLSGTSNCRNLQCRWVETQSQRFLVKEEKNSKANRRSHRRREKNDRPAQFYRSVLLCPSNDFSGRRAIFQQFPVEITYKWIVGIMGLGETTEFPRGTKYSTSTNRICANGTWRVK